MGLETSYGERVYTWGQKRFIKATCAGCIGLVTFYGGNVLRKGFVRKRLKFVSVFRFMFGETVYKSNCPVVSF